jgi:S-adenosylmethionine synthetase
MANPLLRHTGGSLTTSNATYVNTVTTGRAFVISKLTIAASAACTVTVQLGSYNICTTLPLSAGQVWSESGLVLIAGETLGATCSVSSAAMLSVFGEEVDN